MKVFLTGATGYVGSVVAEKLLAKGHEVGGLVRSEASEAKLPDRKVIPIRGDLGDFDVLKKGAAEADAVIHTAFNHDFSDYNDAVKLDRNVIATFAEALEGTKKPFIITSSSAILGDTTGVEADEDYPFDQYSPRILRGESERDVLSLSSNGVRSIVLRLPLFVYGRAGSSFVPYIIKQAKDTGAASYAESGSQKVSAVHVEDAADMYLLALETTTAKGLYNIASESVSLKELNEAAARLLNIEAKSIPVEKAKAQFGGMFNFLSINNELSSEKAKRDLGWKARNIAILDDIENGSYRKFKEEE